ncbi:MAG: hypothetical protein QOF29_1180 [bacterium]
MRPTVLPLARERTTPPRNVNLRGSRRREVERDQAEAAGVLLGAAASGGLGARSREAANVAPLPRRLDGMGVVVPADPRRRASGGHATELRDARQRRSGPASATTAGNLDANALDGRAMRLLECRPRVPCVERQPEVRPAKPPARPRSLGGPPAEEIEPPLRALLRWGTVAEAATAKTRTVRQLHDAWPEVPRHPLILRGPACRRGYRGRRSASRPVAKESVSQPAAVAPAR